MTDSTRVTRYLLIGLAVVILLILISQYYSKNQLMVVAPLQEKETFVHAPFQEDSSITETSSDVQPSEIALNDQFRSVNFKDSKPIDQCAPKDKLKVEDLLPKDAANSKWAQVNPAGQGDVDNKNFLTAGYLVGVNTVGPSLRNANQQIRSDPPIERMSVGPWNQTTIEYDGSRKFFEIGEC
jgi:hypothetical protein